MSRKGSGLSSGKAPDIIPEKERRGAQNKSKHPTEYMVKLRKIQRRRGLLMHLLGNMFKNGSVFQRQNGKDSSINKVDSMLD